MVRWEELMQLYLKENLWAMGLTAGSMWDLIFL